MHILYMGDLVSPKAIDVVDRMVRKLRRDYPIDLVVCNAENVHRRNGIKKDHYDRLRAIGIDVMTLGNHAWDQDQVTDFIDECPDLIRPFNYPPDTPGQGSVVVDCCHRQVGIIVAMGNVGVSHLPSPFVGIDAEIDRLKSQGVRHIIVEIHAEATAEKGALAYYLDGRVGAVLGSHTHIPTADERILPKGTGFQTDIGMVGPWDSVIGMAKEASIARFRTQRKVRYAQADSDTYIFNANLLELDREGLCASMVRIQEKVVL